MKSRIAEQVAKEKDIEVKHIPFPKIVDDKTARANLIQTLTEDQDSRLESQKNANMYLLGKEKEVESLPYWIWAILWFALGWTACLASEVSLVGLLT